MNEKDPIPVQVVPDQPRNPRHRSAGQRRTPTRTYAGSFLPTPAMASPGSGTMPLADLTLGVLDERAARGLYLTVRFVRILFSWATLSVPITLLLFVAFSGGLLRAQLVEGTAFMAFMQFMVRPVAELAEQLFPFRTLYYGFNWWIAGVAGLAFFVRRVLLDPLEEAERRTKTRAFYAEWDSARSQ